MTFLLIPLTIAVAFALMWFHEWVVDRPLDGSAGADERRSTDPDRTDGQRPTEGRERHLVG